MKQTKAVALCGVMAALSVIIMLLGAALELGIYMSPMIAGACLLPVARRYGVRWHVLLWVAVSILSLILVPHVEENLMYICLFGCYPIIRPYLQRLPRGLRVLVKLLLFNIVFVALELLVMLVLVPETVDAVLIVLILLFGNITFFCYDSVLPLADVQLERFLGKIMK